jgi:hypothetical protein
MKNKRCSVDQQIDGQWTYQWTTEVVPSSGLSVPFPTPGILCAETDDGKYWSIPWQIWDWQKRGGGFTQFILLKKKKKKKFKSVLQIHIHFLQSRI